jgi:hypothetical protein
MAVTYAHPPGAKALSPKRGPISRLIEDERWLAFFLLLPTLVLLGLFIAYPCVWRPVQDDGNKYWSSRRLRGAIGGRQRPLRSAIRSLAW